ncbi:MAG: hypothetical protein KC777_30110, partial [Cyanobacteria bacterium HKST-UBA02]|nr:hypothetical protein [Cyanobacteria bacterium HKST-UBA02]
RDIGPVEVIATSADGEVSSRFVDVEPLPSGFDRLLFRLERNVIQRHEDFREICAILAYMLCLRLFSKRDQDSSAAHHLALLNLSPPVLSEYADRHHRGELGVGSLVRFIILKSIEGDIDALPVWQGFDRL